MSVNPHKKVFFLFLFFFALHALEEISGHGNLLEHKKVLTQEQLKSNRIGLGRQYGRRFIFLGHHMVAMTSFKTLCASAL